MANKIITDIPIGSTMNWGQQVNNNFNIIDKEIKKIYNNINGTQALVGADIPYIDLRDEWYWVSIIIVPENTIYKDKNLQAGAIILRYYSKDSNPDPNSGTAVFNEFIRTDEKWLDNKIPSLFAAAYIYDIYKFTNGKILLLEDGDQYTTFDGKSYKRGTILVRTQRFGSLYGNDYIAATFNNYPIAAEYYIPQMQSEKPYQLTFIKTDYVTWFFNSQNKTYTLPSIGLGNFNYFTIAKNSDGDSISVLMNGSAINLCTEYDENNIPCYSLDTTNNILSIHFAVTKKQDDIEQCGNNVLLHTNWTAYTSEDTSNGGKRDTEELIYIAHSTQQHYNANGNGDKNLFDINCDISHLTTETIKCTFWFTYKNNFA